MFKRREPMYNGMPEGNPNMYGGNFYQDNQMQRVFYQFEETNRIIQNFYHDNLCPFFRPLL